ncbi:hypothetical protein POM88_011459 [Heracleum sosnowskyi]|uniref:Uncharacterized protein n=1 Tax=Heracleum sosnowskyi TaxID=360622 RepID=A0AAD8N2F4_9APIA|nr:hypothetical protein POM88_011459 [Heracleum sosnowskyi]
MEQAPRKRGRPKVFSDQRDGGGTETVEIICTADVPWERGQQRLSREENETRGLPHEEDGGATLNENGRNGVSDESLGASDAMGADSTVPKETYLGFDVIPSKVPPYSSMKNILTTAVWADQKHRNTATCRGRNLYYHNDYSGKEAEVEIGFESGGLAQSVLKQGLARRIGTGRNVNILADPWLPNDEDPYVYTVNEALTVKMVSSLMITGHNQWDVDLLADFFEDRDTNLILFIPSQNADSWYWSRENLGRSTVKECVFADTRDERSQPFE